MPYRLLHRTGYVGRLVGALVSLAFVLGAGSCKDMPTARSLDPRYVAVHNALAAAGFVEVGPIRRGALTVGHETRVPIEVSTPCTTIVVMGTDGVRDLDVTLLDPAGATVAHDTSHESEAALRACIQSAGGGSGGGPGTYTLVLRTGAGSDGTSAALPRRGQYQGEYLLASWSEMSPSGNATTPGTVLGLSQASAGTCESPIRIGAGEYTGSTTHGESENEGQCANSGARELVYRLDLPTRQSVTLEVVTQRFDSVLYVRKSDCSDESAEVACNDDAPNQHRSKIDGVFDPGTYYVFVDGYGSDGGPFQLKVTLRDIPALAELCGRAAALVSGVPQPGVTTGTFDEVAASCGDGAHGPDTPFVLEVPVRSRARIRNASDDFSPVVHVRRRCADEGTEVGCAATETGEHTASFVGLLDPGTYTVFADASDHEADGKFSLTAELVPEQGSGAPGDGCADALPLPHGEPTVHGDTFRARDHTAGKCGGGGAADVLYELELPKRTRFVATFTSEEATHIFVLSKTCADRSSEIACGRTVDETLAAGTYFLAVDGNAPDAFGAYAFDWHARDVAAQEAGCKSAPLLVDGKPVSGTTVGASNKFTPTCAGTGNDTGDRVYRMTLPQRGHVRISLQSPRFTGVLALRSSCLDTIGGGGSHPIELGCNTGDDAHQAHLEANLEAGTYYVIVDGRSLGQQGEGEYTLQYHAVR
jgi:hypothetical protein